MPLREGPSPVQDPPLLDLSKLRTIRSRDLMIRFAFGATVSAVSGIVGEVAGHTMAGLFLGFPAILPATLTLMEKRDGLAQAVSDVRGATLGALGMVAFAIVAVALLPRTPGWALPTALVTWVVASVVLYALLRGVLHTTGERQYLPEISATEAAPVIDCLREHGLTLGLAESCTGGTVAALLTSVPSAGDVIAGSIVSYSDSAKRDVVGVPGELIEDRTSVSAAVAREMARGAKQRFGADVGLAITGLLGTPKDGDAGGETYIALCTPDDRVLVREYSDDHGPGRNRERDVRMAFQLVLDAIRAERSPS